MKTYVETRELLTLTKADEAWRRHLGKFGYYVYVARYKRCCVWIAAREVNVGEWTGNPTDVAICLIYGFDKVYRNLLVAQLAAFAWAAGQGERCGCDWHPFDPKEAT